MRRVKDELVILGLHQRHHRLAVAGFVGAENHLPNQFLGP